MTTSNPERVLSAAEALAAALNGYAGDNPFEDVVYQRGPWTPLLTDSGTWAPDSTDVRLIGGVRVVWTPGDLGRWVVEG